MSHPKYDESKLLTCGQDIGLTSFRKIFACHVLNSIKVIELGSYAFLFSLNNRPVTTVEIVGVIRGIENKSKRVTYTCDDGTGILACIKFLDGQTRFHDIQLGDVVSVKGSIALLETNNTSYGFVLQVKSIVKLVDPNLEILHWATTIHQHESDREHLEKERNILTPLQDTSMKISPHCHDNCTCDFDSNMLRQAWCRLLFCPCMATSKDSISIKNQKIILLEILLVVEKKSGDSRPYLFSVDDLMYDSC